MSNPRYFSGTPQQVANQVKLQDILDDKTPTPFPVGTVLENVLHPEEQAKVLLAGKLNVQLQPLLNGEPYGKSFPANVVIRSFFDDFAVKRRRPQQVWVRPTVEDPQPEDK